MLIDEKIVVTAALPYSNGELHLGHIVSTYLPADIFVRYLRHRGADVVFVCGGDDYGTPILIQAEKEGRSPEDYVEYWHQQHIRDFNDAGISFNLYYKPTLRRILSLPSISLRLYMGRATYILGKLSSTIVNMMISFYRIDMLEVYAHFAVLLTNMVMDVRNVEEPMNP